MQVTYSQVRNPRWGNQEHTLLLCEVKFDFHGDEFLPFSCVAEGDYPHTHEIFARCVAGEFGQVAEYVPPAPPTDEQIVAAVRFERDLLLAESDWTQLPDVPQSTKDIWASYRQALRDITIQSGFPKNVSWPVKPSQT